MSISSRPKKMVILAIDDDLHNLKALSRIFNDYDEYTLHCCESGDEGLKEVPHLNPDLILLDIKMPGMSGYEVCQRIKTNPETKDIMVLLLSGNSSLADRLKGYEVEADDYITKPFHEQELFAKVKILLRLKYAQDQLVKINSELSTLVDIKTREVASKEGQALVGQMVLGIIHNLSGPITGARGQVELSIIRLNELLEGLDGKSEHLLALQTIKQHLEKSLEASDTLADMINGMLSKGRFDAQKAPQELDLNTLISNEIDFLNADMHFKHKVEKKIYLDKGIPHIHGVPADFSQLFYNLIKNAADAMQSSDQKVLTITTSFDNSSVYIRFQDTGHGLKPGDENEIFEPFYTTKPSADEAQVGEATGTGLGLYTCLELVKLYSGSIKAESPEDGGCLFTVTIPQVAFEQKS